jgi:cellulose synthase operon protein C
MARASWYARRKLKPMAVTEFKAVLGLAPDDVTALNQLALLLFDADAEKATAYARRAYELAPTRAAVLDTYGWLLVRQQRYLQGLKLLRAAEARAGGRPNIVYHIAVALHGVGRREAGLRALKKALRSSETFSGRVEADALRQRWEQRAAGKIPASK